MNNMEPGVLIVILNYGTFDVTVNLIQTIKKNLEYMNYSIMVIDNCSPNESKEVLLEKSNELNYIFFSNENNFGYAVGNNIGIRYGIEHGYKYSWILNNDIELREKNVLKHMVSIMENNSRIGCIGPKIYTYDDKECFPYCRRQSFWNMTLGIAAEKKYRQKYKDTSMKVYRVYGCCMLLNNLAMKEVDCMDERTFLYGEEDILAERMLMKDYITYYDADVSVTHMESLSMKRMTFNRKKLHVYESGKSRDIYLKEYRGFNFFERWVCHLIRSLIIYIR